MIPGIFQLQLITKEDQMCDVTAYLVSHGAEEIILENVEIVEETADGIRLVNIFGEERSLQAKMIRYSNSDKKMVFSNY